MIRLASGSSLAFQRLSRRSGYWRERVGLPNTNSPTPLLWEQGRAPIHGVYVLHKEWRQRGGWPARIGQIPIHPYGATAHVCNGLGRVTRHCRGQGRCLGTVAVALVARPFDSVGPRPGINGTSRVRSASCPRPFLDSIVRPASGPRPLSFLPGAWEVHLKRRVSIFQPSPLFFWFTIAVEVTDRCLHVVVCRIAFVPSFVSKRVVSLLTFPSPGTNHRRVVDATGHRLCHYTVASQSAVLQMHLPTVGLAVPTELLPRQQRNPVGSINRVGRPNAPPATPHPPLPAPPLAARQGVPTTLRSTGDSSCRPVRAAAVDGGVFLNSAVHDGCRICGSNGPAQNLV
eukprot:gene13700-biopygen513